MSTNSRPNHMASMTAAATAKRAMKKQRSEALSKRKVEFHAAPKPKRKTVPDDMQDDPIIDDAQMLDAAPEITRRTTRVTGQSRVRDFLPSALLTTCCVTSACARRH